MNTLIGVCGGILAVCLLIPSLIIPRRKSGSFCLSFIAGYLIFMVIMSLWYFPGEKDAQEELFWLGPGLLTLPSSLLIMVLPAFSMGNKLVYLVVLGVGQYGLIGLLIDLIINRFGKNTANHTPDGIRHPADGPPKSSV